MNFWRLVIPRMPRKTVLPCFALAGLGALIAGAYGVIHDQITYTLSAEYFTNFKFIQFDYADPRYAFGLGNRWFVAVIGFLATWWVGAIAGWSLGRCSVMRDGTMLPIATVLRCFGLMIVSSAVCAAVGYFIGSLAKPPDYGVGSWETSMAFDRVGMLHNGSYLGAVAGLVISIILVLRERNQRSKG